jgi:hypothetical protein
MMSRAVLILTVRYLTNSIEAILEITSYIIIDYSSDEVCLINISG